MIVSPSGHLLYYILIVGGLNIEYRIGKIGQAKTALNSGVVLISRALNSGTLL